ncbi:MAG: hypothetical protein IT290_10440 [Deltaproteobacteria bacterium]|nr:hypothetical protein [Deltaproteobacteria bacterium]
MRHRILACAALFLTACTLPKALDPIIANRPAKYRMLNEQVGLFHRALNWGDTPRATEHVAPEAQGDFGRMVLGEAANHRIIDVRVDKMDYPPEDDDTAFVEATVRYYRVASMRVENASNRETWKYSRMNGAWQLVKAEKIKTDPSVDRSAIGGFIR